MGRPSPSPIFVLSPALVLAPLIVGPIILFAVVPAIVFFGH
ncbi:MAG: hypothetical protein ABSD49_09115 [Candidatus Bathyarchaeia archaeon]